MLSFRHGERNAFAEAIDGIHQSRARQRGEPRTADFVHKSLAVAELIDAVRKVAAGGTLITPNAIASLLERRREVKSKRGILTARETHVLSLMAQGLSSREIASRLAISYVTVRSHIRSVGGKLAAHSKLQAVARARELALID